MHESKAIDGGLNPHVHLMFSERRNDGIDRLEDEYFRRYSPKDPSKGGAKKGYGVSYGQTLTYKQRKEELQQLRSRWEEVVNKHLELAGSKERISMQSYKARGIDIEPEKKQLPSKWRKTEVRQRMAEERETKKIDLELKQELAQLMPNIDLEITRLEQDLKKQRQQEEIERLKQENEQLNKFKADLLQNAAKNEQHSAPIEPMEQITSVGVKHNLFKRHENIFDLMVPKEAQTQEKQEFDPYAIVDKVFAKSNLAELKSPLHHLLEEKNQISKQETAQIEATPKLEPTQENKPQDLQEDLTPTIDTEKAAQTAANAHPKHVTNSREEVRQMWMESEARTIAKNNAHSRDDDDLER